MFKNLSIRLRILALAGLLIFLSIVIAGAGWYAISQVSAALAESIRVARQAQFVTVGIREFAGADRRVVSYLQTATDDDEQRYTTRKTDSDAAFGQSLEKDTTEVIKANGGTVLGSVKHPLSASDF